MKKYPHERAGQIIVSIIIKLSFLTPKACHMGVHVTNSVFVVATRVMVNQNLMFY